MSEHLTFNQVNDQESTAYMRGNEANPTVLIKRSDGRITVGQLDKAESMVHFTEEDKDLSKPVRPEAMSDQMQEKLARELGESALRGQVSLPEHDTKYDAPVYGDDNPHASVENAAVDSSRMEQARTAADHKYNSVRAAGGTHEEAESASERVWKGFGF